MSTQKQIAVAFMLIVLIAAVAKAQTRVSPLAVREQSEPFIAVNPTDPNNLIIVAISFQSVSIVSAVITAQTADKIGLSMKTLLAAIWPAKAPAIH